MSRSSAVASAIVWRGDERVGRLDRTNEGGAFEVDAAFLDKPRPSWDRGLAYRLAFEPRRHETRGTNLHTFFAGLLPEGLRLRALEQRVKTSRDDLLSLLIEAGADCVGDVWVTADADTPPRVTPTVDPRRLGEVSFRELLEASLAGQRGVEPLIPGVQEKISAAMISLPIRGARRGADHILKLCPPRTPHLLENEYFFLRMAADLGARAAEASLVRDGVGELGLLVRRFDRVVEGGARRRLHQEDACQFLDRYPADKYAVSMSEIAAAIVELSTAPIVELAKLIRLIAFSYLIGNGDLHAKNVSLRTIGGRVELTPAYDVLSTLPYGDRTMAIKLDGKDDNLRRAMFVAFAERFGVRPRATEAILDEVCDRAPEWIANLGEIGLDSRRTADLRRVMTKRRDDLGVGRASGENHRKGLRRARPPTRQ